MTAPVAQAVAEFDVLDLRPRETTRVEAAGSVEQIPPHGATTRPEGVGLAGALHVHVAVQKIPILRYETGRGRGIVVRAKDRGHLRMLVNRAREAAQRIRVQHDVGVHEDDPIPSRPGDSVVARLGGTARWLPEPDDLIGKAPCDLGGVVTTRVINDDQLPCVARQVACRDRAEHRG